MVVRVKYVFGLARGHDGRDEIRLELPGGATVFEAMQRLGVSALELHAAVNGASAADGAVLRDGDEVTLIPAIQGGRGVDPMRVVAVVLVTGLAGAALAALATPEATAQGRVIVPIIVPRPAPSGPSQVTIQGPPQPAGAAASGPVRGGSSVPSGSREVKITTPGGPTTRVTVEPVRPNAGRSGPAPAQAGASTPSYSNETQVTVRQNTGPGTPETTTERIRIFSDGAVETPVIIVPE